MKPQSWLLRPGKPPSQIWINGRSLNIVFLGIDFIMLLNISSLCGYWSVLVNLYLHWSVMSKTVAACLFFMQGWAGKCFAAATVGAVVDQEITQQNTGFVQPAGIATIIYIYMYL